MDNPKKNLENRIRIIVIDGGRELVKPYEELFGPNIHQHPITEPRQYNDRNLDKVITQFNPDLMIIELQLHGGSFDVLSGGYNAIDYYHKNFPTVPIVCCSPYINNSKSGLKNKKRAIKSGAVDALPKMPLPEADAFLKYIRRKSNLGQIKYVPPVLKGFGEEYTGGVVQFTEQDKWRDMYQGAFVVCAVDDAIRVYALVRGASHLDVHAKLNAEGRILAGGQIGYHPKRNQGGVSGSSYHFGSLPNKVLEDYFRSFGFNIRADMVEEAVSQTTKEWFREHTITI